ncbi:hypothetical protein HYFRA_00012984 [Hymenoscyphus fraxineus]|uniref:laccase n=1 Tax=Hymenoscyphus fraxineus TaxID=746836 RepID=A0A9N9PTH3_9HELO|nr:hypothetical protein HYFRA_00012984 [Hymenoscyphus fraxineus]
MFFNSLLAASAALVLSGVNAAPSVQSQARQAPAACEHGPNNRQCWGEYSTSTDYYNVVPDTGKTVEYWFELINGTAALDGVTKQVLTVNGTFPGPTITADWGDNVVVHLKNSLANNGTGLHFHGLRQNYTNMMDGVPSITQCAQAPGDTMTYRWRATQYGSTWYHSHFALQAWEGVLGAIVINGPATANYDHDMGHMFLNDWDHETPDVLYHSAQTQGPPALANGLINGMNVYENGGKRFEVSVFKDQSYRIRLVNGAIDTHFKFMIDNHNFTVISMDLVPIVPYETNMISIGMGQRYDIIVKMDQAPDNYWIRAIPQTFCSENENTDNIKAILRYDPTSTADPTTTEYTYVDSCDDEALSNLVPFFAQNAGDQDSTQDFGVTVGTSNNLFKWFMQGTTFEVEWENPTLLQLAGGVHANYTKNNHVITLDGKDEWVYWIIETTMTVPHPLHLHGHDFFILAQGTGTYDPATTTLQKVNPPRRDVAMLPAGGFVVMAFLTDNPGAWLMHCHIGWHASEGFAIQMVERVSEIPAITDFNSMNDVCNKWDSYVAVSGVEREDSGI